MQGRRIYLILSLCVSSLAAHAAQRDADYPARPIRLMVPQNPGASVDNVSRILAARMGEELGQQIVADNRAGAGGTLAAEVVRSVRRQVHADARPSPEGARPA